MTAAIDTLSENGLAVEGTSIDLFKIRQKVLILHVNL
jgi:hypothetical protein